MGRSALGLVAAFLAFGEGGAAKPRIPGVFWAAPDAVQSSAACASVIFFQGSQDGGPNITRLPEGQLFDHSRPIVYSSILKGCVQCAPNRYFSAQEWDTEFFGPAHCKRCPEGEVQDETGLGSMPMRRLHEVSCKTPLVFDPSTGGCNCPMYTQRVPDTDYCECIDPTASTEYDHHTHEVTCSCPAGTTFSLGQCLCPKEDQIYDSVSGLCSSCPVNYAPSGGRCVCKAQIGEPGVNDLKVCDKRWFQSKMELQTYLAAQINADPEHVCIDNVRGDCEWTLVDVSAPDACEERSSVTLPVHYDPTCPEVSTRVEMDTLDMRVPGLHDVGFHFNASDDCGLVPSATTLSVYSNQKHAYSTSPQVRVHPIYDNAGGLINFQVFLRARVFMKCDAVLGKLCMGNCEGSRLYILRLCVTNTAGCTSCSETHVKVTKSSLEGLFHSQVPLNKIVVPKVTSLSGSSVSSLLGAASDVTSLASSIDDSSITSLTPSSHHDDDSAGTYILGVYTASA